MILPPGWHSAVRLFGLISAVQNAAPQDGNCVSMLSERINMRLRRWIRQTCLNFDLRAEVRAYLTVDLPSLHQALIYFIKAKVSRHNINCPSKRRFNSAVAGFDDSYQRSRRSDKMLISIARHRDSLPVSPARFVCHDLET